MLALRCNWMAWLYARFELCCTALQPAFALGVRLYLARVFWLSGLTKLRSWDSTLYLFTSEYHVPLLPPAVAAVMGAGGELLLPLLLLTGWAGRFGATGLLILNCVAVISYPGLEPIQIKDHVLWGILLVYLMVHGMGAWSVDGWRMRRRLRVRGPGTQ
ncbi:DoxX family protein [Amantichitinum ursilacus]|uniref:DoxX n=1 Tax=Amantichitinum ursilacus TaxID=857265 RepID=A0A0N0GLR7_9NEIS|nr:DoxX family protein [Amantichitinum ursilacus]KPC50414.1 DoxX [Amantichitinum ursilacus]